VGVLDGLNANGLFVSSADQNAQMESFAQRGLTKALQLFSNKRYAEAIPVFKRAIGMSPRSETALNAYDYLAKSYLSLEEKDTRSAIATYEQSLRLAPDRAATHMALGNIHFEDENHEAAQAAYAQAVKLDGSAGNRYALGQALLELGRYDEAESQFRKVREQSPRKPDGDFGLGLVYARQGRGEEAIGAFQRAIETKADFWFSYEELGYVLTDQGELEQARELVDILEPKAPELATTLSRYITQQTPPEMVSVYSTSTFLYTLGPRTQVAALGDYLTEPGSQRSFSMAFQFSKSMDAQSVENVLNWSISRSLDTGRADGYNFSLPIPATEVSLPANPSSVEYDAETGTATLFFSVRQNDTADGTIDPYHIKFSFKGLDAEGLAMNSQADEYTGFSGFA
jgi:tetratricopeptide (TPR) repeat protein